MSEPEKKPTHCSICGYCYQWHLFDTEHATLADCLKQIRTDIDGLLEREMDE